MVKEDPSTFKELLMALYLMVIEIIFLLLISLAIKRLFRKLKVPLKEDERIIDIQRIVDIDEQLVANNSMSEFICENSPHGRTYSIRVKLPKEKEYNEIKEHSTEVLIQQ